MQDERFRLPQSSNGSSLRDHETQCNSTLSDFRLHRHATLGGFCLQGSENCQESRDDLMDIPGLIRSLPGVVFFVCAFAAAFVAIGLYVGWRSYRLAGLIATTRVTAASAAQEGKTAIEGKASAPPIGKELRAPLTGSICCWFHCTIEEYVRGASSKEWGWRTVEDQTSEWPFLISDESGQCSVWPAGAEIVPPKDRSVWPFRLPKSPIMEKPQSRWIVILRANPPQSVRGSGATPLWRALRCCVFVIPRSGSTRATESMRLAGHRQDLR
jgi:hypothetical protein